MPVAILDLVQDMLRDLALGLGLIISAQEE